MAKKTKKEIETIPFSATEFIVNTSSKLSIRNGADILRFEKITKIIEEVEAERNEKIQGIFAKHQATNEDIHEIIDGKKNDKYDKSKADAVNADWKEIYMKGSSVDRKRLQLYSFDELVDALPRDKKENGEEEARMSMKPFEVTGLKFWLVKEVEDK